MSSMKSAIGPIHIDDIGPDFTGYGWIIDKDHIAMNDEEEGTNLNAVGVVGPSNIAPEIHYRLNHGQGKKFRMYDDDGELYYSGRILHADGYEAPDEGFEPLDDFGTGNAGCTEIKYFERNEWRTL